MEPCRAGTRRTPCRTEPRSQLERSLPRGARHGAAGVSVEQRVPTPGGTARGHTRLLCHPALVLPFRSRVPPHAAAGLCGKAPRRRWELAELRGDMKGHVHPAIPLFREQNAAEIDFPPCLLEFLPPGADKKGLGWRLPAPEQFAGCVYY